MSDFRIGAVFKGALIGGVAAGVFNIGLFFVGRACGATFLARQEGSPELVPIPPFMPMVNCVMSALVAAAILAALIKLAPERAWKIFLGVAVVAFLLYSALPVLALGHDTISVAFLELMHVPAAIGIVGGIRRFGRG